MSRRTLLLSLGAVVAALALVGGTWLVASRFQSPAQRAAQAQPPAATPVLVTVTRGDVVERTTLTATASAASPATYTLPAPSGTAVVTAAGPGTGGTLAAGQAVAWVNDRPVIALPGAFPLYRDLGPGDTGADVRQLQSALTTLGYSVRADGVFGSATARALTRLYTQVGAKAATRPAAQQPASTPAQAAQAPAEPAATGQDGQEQAANATATSAAQVPAAGTAATKTEVYLPVTEVLVVAQLPAHIDYAPAVGTVLNAQTGTLRLSDGSMQLTASPAGVVALRLAQGMSGTATVGSESVPVTVAAVNVPTLPAQSSGSAGTTQEDGSGTTAPAESAPGGQASAAGTPAGGEASATGSSAGSTTPTVVLVAQQGSVPAGWAGRSDVLVTIDLTEPLTGVLTVPQRALAATADGAANVLLQRSDGSFTQVRVTQKSCVAGTCAIEADEASGVVEGAQVRVDRP